MQISTLAIVINNKAGCLTTLECYFVFPILFYPISNYCYHSFVLLFVFFSTISCSNNSVRSGRGAEFWGVFFGDVQENQKTCFPECMVLYAAQQKYELKTEKHNGKSLFHHMMAGSNPGNHASIKRRSYTRYIVPTRFRGWERGCGW